MFFIICVESLYSLWFIFELSHTDHRLHFFHLLEVCDDRVNIFYIMYIELDMPFEQPVYGFNKNLADVDIQLLGYDVANLV